MTLDRDFAGEYNGWRDKDNNWEYLTGPIAKGVYYDAENDEIQISDVDGLIWLQRMVNGDLKVRQPNKQTYNGKTGYDGYYLYYTQSGAENNFTECGAGISDPTIGHEDDLAAQALKTRILRATHQDQNDTDRSGWPENNNFHFMGVKRNGNEYTVSKATVRLMNNIDLSGIEWIPIGFDAAVYDGSPKEYFDAITNYRYTKKAKDDNGAVAVRAFCGDFKGENHTISNITTKRYGAKVHETGVEDGSEGPYDNPQWFPTGFFGMLGGNASVTDLKVYNVSFHGYHTGGGIAGIACGDEINIINCSVDGGSVHLAPMFRGDGHKDVGYTPKDEMLVRTFARGIYAGGIVGYYNATGNITKNKVRNLTIKAYRNIGGVVGSMASCNDTKTEGEVKLKGTTAVEENSVSNVLVIANKFQPYDYCFNTIWNIDEDENATEFTLTPKVYRSGYGWVQNQLALAGEYVGGLDIDNKTEHRKQYAEYAAKKNQQSNLRISEFATKVTDYIDSERQASIGDVPLQELPMLSSWFCDTITLNANYYGISSARRIYKDHQFKIPRVKQKTDSKYYIKSLKDIDAYFPFNLPYNVSVDFKESGLGSEKVGLYVESVRLKGNAIGGRSVITPSDVRGENSCVMYVTAHDRTLMWSVFELDKYKPTEEGTLAKDLDWYKQPTEIKNVVLRGDPYAWAGILFAPNKSMSGVVLDSVFIYDVYKTIALDNAVEVDGTSKFKKGADFSKENGITLKVSNSNFRGYTVPGAGWASVEHDNVTFEQGAYTQQGNEEDRRTYKVEANTTFTNYFFKAPYTIIIAEGGTAKFEGTCKATSSSVKTEPIVSKTECTRIEITSNSQGDPVVTYYNANGKNMDDSATARRR